MGFFTYTGASATKTAIKSAAKPGFFGWLGGFFTGGVDDLAKGAGKAGSAVGHLGSAAGDSAKAVGYGTRGVAKIGAGGAIVGGAVLGAGMAGDAANDYLRGPDSTQQSFLSGGTGSNSKPPGTDTSPFSELGKSWGLGSAIFGGLGLAAGYYGMEHSGIAIGLGAIGAWLGQPAFDAISGYITTLTTPTAPSGQKSNTTAPSQQQHVGASAPQLTEEAKKQAEAAKNAAVTGGQQAAAPTVQVVPAQQQPAASAPTPGGN